MLYTGTCGLTWYLGKYKTLDGLPGSLIVICIIIYITVFIITKVKLFVLILMLKHVVLKVKKVSIIIYVSSRFLIH